MRATAVTTRSIPFRPKWRVSINCPIPLSISTASSQLSSQSCNVSSSQRNSLLLPLFRSIHQRRFSSSSSSSSKESASTHRRSIFGWYSEMLTSYPLSTKAVTSGLIAGAGDMICQTIIVTDNVDVVASTRTDDDGDDQTIKSGNDQESSSSSFLQTWDRQRTFRFWFLGTFLVAPIIHVWYGMLATTIAPGTHVRAVLKRVVFDQTIFTPIIMTSWLCSLWTLERFDPKRMNTLTAEDNTTTTTTTTTMTRTTLPQRRPPPPPRFAEMPTKLIQDVPSLLVANWSLWIPAQIINFKFVPLPFQVLYSNIVSLLWNTYLSFATTTHIATTTKTKATTEQIDEKQ